VTTRIVASVPPAASGRRLDRFVAEIEAVGSRARGRQLIDRGLVQVDGRARKPAFEVAAGMTVSVDVPPEEPLAAVPQDIPLDLLHVDDEVIVVNKPAGMVVHPAAGARDGTLVNALLHRFGALGGSDPSRPGIVHRLDRDTSGVMVVARSRRAHEHLSRQFRSRTVEKTYWGLARGRVAREEGEVTWAVGRHPTERKRMSVASRRGRDASTAYRVVERLPGATVLELRPRTGRTHQIRVHVAAMGHPLVGDRLYGGGGSGRGRPAPWVAVLSMCPRHALHAGALAFRHPQDDRAMRFEAGVPGDLMDVVEALRGLLAGSSDERR
jgi:23S rRNA pseudouridine1911/1915/1917 synthase